MNNYDRGDVIRIDSTETEPEGWMYETEERKSFSDYTQEEAAKKAEMYEKKLFDLYLQRLGESGLTKQEVAGLGDEIVERNLENAAETAEELSSLLES